MDRDILIFGGGGHAKTIIDLIRSLNTWTIKGIIDDGLEPGDAILGVPVIGKSERLAELRAEGVDYAVNTVGGIGNYHVRQQVFKKLESAGYKFPALIHPAALVEPSAVIADGVQILAHAYISSASTVAFGTLINAGVILSHDCQIGRCVNLSPGALLAGEVCVDDFAQIGMGATINLQVRIGRAARIGNSAVVKADVPENGRVYAGSVWPYSPTVHEKEMKPMRKIA